MNIEQMFYLGVRNHHILGIHVSITKRKEEKKYHFAVEDQNTKIKESRKDEYERENVNNIEITDEKTK